MPASVQLGPRRNLEDAEVAVLYQIVAKALSSFDVDTYPWRSLHRAYQETLSENDIDELQDSIYLRFLFELRERNRPDQSLFVAFQELLLKYGIEIQVPESSLGDDDLSQTDDYALVDEEDDIQGNDGTEKKAQGDVTLALERFGRPAVEVARAAQKWMPSPRRSRRASFESIYNRDDADEREGPAKRRPDSRASFSQIAENTGRLSPGPEFEDTNRHPPRPWEASMLANASSPVRPLRGTRPQSQITLLSADDRQIMQDRSLISSVSEFGGFVGDPKPTQKHAMSQSSEEELPFRQVRTLATSGPRPGGLAVSNTKYGAATNPATNVQPPRADPYKEILHHDRSGLPQKAVEHLYGPTDFRLILKAQEFETRRLRISLGKILYHWLEQAYESFKHQETLERRATQWDARLLKQDSFRVWHGAFVHLRDVRESMRAMDLFYAQQERNAADLRDAMLLRKALVHWAQCAAEETERASLAKKHLMRFRYFQAWREHTVATEIKVRRHILGKWFKKWRKPSSKQQRNGLLVADYHEDTLIKRFFLQWVWRMREVRVQRQGEAATKKAIFDRLLQKFRSIQENHQIVVQARQRAALQSIQKQAQDQYQLIQRADYFDRSRLLKSSLVVVVRQHQHSSTARKISSMVDWRIAADAFFRIRQQYHFEREARDYDCQRLLRRSLSTWNSQLRERYLVKKVNDRILTQHLYRWVLAERGRLFERLHKERLLSRCGAKVFGYWSQQSQELINAFVSCRRLQKERAMRSAMQVWWSKTRTNLRHEAAAVAKDNLRLKTTTMAVFSSRLDRVRVLEEQYLPNAEIWFTGGNALRRWQEATRKAKKRKRHDAYAVVRRQVKQNLAKRCLQQWRDKSRALSSLEEKSSQYKKQSLELVGTSLFYQWQSKLRETQQREESATKKRKEHLINKSLAVWKAKSRDMKDRLAVAQEHDSEHTRRAAYRTLRTLHFRIRRIQELNVGGSVDDFVQWSRRRYDRALLRLWLEKTLRKRGMAEIDIPATARTRRFKSLLNQSQLRDNPRALVTRPVDVLAQDLAPLNLEEPSMTPAIPPPSTPSRRRFARLMKTPGPTKSAIPVARSVAASNAAVSGALDVDNPFGNTVAPATDPKIMQNRAFGKSTARRLFGTIPERASESYP